MKERSEHNGPDPLSPSEKKSLKKRIFTSVEHSREGSRIIGYAVPVAAMMMLLVGLGIYFYPTPEVPENAVVKPSKEDHTEEPEKVTLILGNGSKIDVDEKEPKITYSNTGRQVDFGTDKSVEQERGGNQAVLYNTLIVPYGKRSTLLLSDGSRVWLNSGSRLTYPTSFDIGIREVHLEGEAIFDVAHNQDKPFQVVSESQRIRVLGTVFNVSDYADEDMAFTVLKKGSVHVIQTVDSLSIEKKDLNLVPGTLATVNKRSGKVVSASVDIEPYFSWREGVLIFKNDGLRTIMRKLARYYDVDIVFTTEPPLSETFSGRLDLREDIDEVLTTIQKTTDLEYERSQEKGIQIMN